MSAESHHDQSIPVLWHRVDSPDVSGYTVSCEAAGNPTRTATATQTADNVIGIVVDNVVNNVEYTCEVAAIATVDVTSGTDTATPSGACIPTALNAPSGWEGIPRCVQDPDTLPSDPINHGPHPDDPDGTHWLFPPTSDTPSCVDDCPSSWLDSFDTFSGHTVGDPLTTISSEQVMDMAADPKRHRVLATTASAATTKVWAIDTRTGDQTMIHERDPSRSTCIVGGNTACGAYMSIAVADDTAYLVWASPGVSGLLRKPTYYDVVMLDLTTNSTQVGPLQTMCTGGDPDRYGGAGGTLPYDPFTYPTAGGHRYHDWGGTVFAVATDGEYLYLSLGSSTAPLIRRASLDSITPGPAMEGYPNDTDNDLARYDHDIRPGHEAVSQSCDTAGDQIAALQGANSLVMGLVVDSVDVWARALDGSVYRFDKTGATPTPSVWQQFPVSGPTTSGTSNALTYHAYTARAPLFTTTNWLYLGDGVSWLRVSKSDPLNRESLAGALRGTHDGVGVGAGFAGTLGVAPMAERIYFTDGDSIRYLKPVAGLTSNTWYRNTISLSGSPTVTKLADVPTPASGAAARLAVSGDGQTLYVSTTDRINTVDTTTGEVGNTGCTNSDAGNQFGRIQWAGPDALWVADSQSGSTGDGAVDFAVCYLSNGGGASSAWVSGMTPDFVSSDDGQTITSRTSVAGGQHQLTTQFHTSAAATAMGSFVPTTGCSIRRSAMKTTDGLAHYCASVAPFSASYSLGVVPFTSIAGDTVAPLSSSASFNLGINRSWADGWVAAGDNMFVASSTRLYQSSWKNPDITSTTGSVRYGALKHTFPTSITSLVVANDKVYVVTNPVSGVSSVYEVY